MSSSPGNLAHGFTLGWNDEILGLVATVTLLVTAVLWSAHAPMVEKTDFALTYVGASIVHQGKGGDLYNNSLQEKLRDSLFRDPSPLLFEHPPFEALLLSPLAALPFRRAYIAWGLMNAAIWAGSMFWLRSYLPWPREPLAYLCLWLLFAPMGVSLYQGQTSLVCLALYATSFVLLKKGKQFRAGLALGFGLIKFQFALPFALVLLIAGKWRIFQGFLTSSFFLAVLSLAAVGVQGIKLYIRFLLMIASNPQNLTYGSAVDMPTFYGFGFAVLGPRLKSAEVNCIVAVASLLLLGWVGWRWRRASEDSSWQLVFCSALAASLLSGSHMFTHDFSPLAIALFVSGSSFAQPTSPIKALSSLRFGLICTLALFWAFPIYFLLIAWHRLYLMCPATLLFTFLTLEGARVMQRFGSMDRTCAVAQQ